MTPFLANKSIGVNNYKWMLVGEDDTVFFVENALRMLGHLDHNLPYFLTDNIQFPQKHIDGEVHTSASASQSIIVAISCLYSTAYFEHDHSSIVYTNC